MALRKTRSVFPDPGDILKKTYAGKTYEARVISVNRDTGRVVVELNQKHYRTLTAAAVSITGNSTNGWTFWGVEDYPKKPH